MVSEPSLKSSCNTTLFFARDLCPRSKVEVVSNSGEVRGAQACRYSVCFI